MELVKGRRQQGTRLLGELVEQRNPPLSPILQILQKAFRYLLSALGPHGGGEVFLAPPLGEVPPPWASRWKHHLVLGRNELTHQTPGEFRLVPSQHPIEHAQALAERRVGLRPPAQKDVAQTVRGRLT